MNVTYKIGIDIGGTFTDLVYTDGDASIKVVKTPTTTDNQALGVLEGLKKIASAEGTCLEHLLNDTEIIIHGTTVATNIMLEFNGARTGLITTEGFRDDIEIRRGIKERIFNPRHPAPVPLARRRHRLTVRERIDREGAVLVPLDEAEVTRAVRTLKDAGIESIGVCLFFGFLNPAHEKKIARIIRREHPEAFISLSHEVLPQIREFERVSTTLVNAYTGPKLSRYLEHLQSELKKAGFENDFFVMLSNGGIMNPGYAGTYAVYSLFSGPAGGVVACSKLIGELCDERNLITVDMGGTSYDVSLIRNGKPSITTDYWVSRYRVAIPILDIHTIGAGGGSIAWVDSGGALQVGPRSAGAVPGPACYGRGGEHPTVTDANVLLGFLDPDNFLGGEMTLDVEAARKAVETKVARPLGLDTMKAAEGIFRIVNNNMANGIRVVSVQRGYDPRDFVLVAFGGNGALHAGIQARELGIRKVIVPRIATAFSARGLLNSNIIINTMRTCIGRSDDYDIVAINSLLASMREKNESDLPASDRTGEIFHNYQMDMHYKGETHEITVPLRSTGGSVTAEDISNAIRAFHAAHENLHTFSNPDDPVHFMNLRLETVVDLPKPPVRRLEFAGEDASPALRGYRSVFFGEEHGYAETPIYDGLRTACGNIMDGPCIIEEPATTVVVYPGQRARLTELDNYEILVH
jgi:N-methylhydantoinase A